MNNANIRIVDSVTKKSLDKVLIIPEFVYTRGITSGAGHGPGYGSDKTFITKPFIYHKRDEIRISKDNSIGIMGVSGWFWIGNSNWLDGLLIVAPGYKMKWFSDFSGMIYRYENRDIRDDEAIVIELMPSSTKESNVDFDYLFALTKKSVLSGDEILLWNKTGDSIIDVKFTDEDRNLINDFIINSLARVPDKQ